MNLSKYKEQAKRAFSWTSFSPEVRGVQTINEFSEDGRSFLASIPVEHHDWASEKYERLFSKWLSAKSRTFSVMITGASGFNNNRHSKANNRERAAYEELTEWRDKMVKRLNRPDKISIDAEYMATEQRLESMKKVHESMKLINKILQSKKTDTEEKIDEIVALGYTVEQATELCQPDRYGRYGFPSYQLTNSNARIKGAEEKYQKLKKRLESRDVETSEYEINGIRIVENVEADRLQMFFEGIPEPSIREELKKKGYRWSPTNKCWQGYFKSSKIDLRFLKFLKVASNEIEKPVEIIDIKNIFPRRIEAHEANTIRAFVVYCQVSVIDGFNGDYSPLEVYACQTLQQVSEVCIEYVDKYDPEINRFKESVVHHPFKEKFAKVTYSGRVLRLTGTEFSFDAVQKNWNDFSNLSMREIQSDNTSDSYNYETLKTSLMNLDLTTN